MEFIGFTALADAVIVVLSWIILYMRKAKMQPAPEKVKYLSYYFVSTFVFLFLISFTILKTSGTTQSVMFLISDLVLWVSMIAFILMMYAGTEGKQKGFWIGVFLLLALCRTLFQLAGIAGLDLSGLGSGITSILSQLDQWLMYAVWVPSALVLLVVGMQSDSALVRMRSIMFSVGILLITFTWAFRFLAAGSVSQDTGYWLIGISSVVGFVLLLGGVFYKGKSMSEPQAMASSNM